MSIIHVQKIKKQLTSIFDNLIDVSDLEDKSDKDKESSFLTRSLAAFTISAICNVEPKNVAKYITDGYQDNGIDAIYFDEGDKKLLFIQSKWHHNGNGSIQKGDCLKFLNGVRDLLKLDFTKANAKIKGLEKEIDKALNDADTNFMLVISHTGVGSLGTEVEVDIENFISEMNDTSDIFAYKILAQKQIYDYITKGSTLPVDFDVTITEWGHVKEPYKAFYGCVKAAEIAIWMEKYYPRIFDPNIRSFLGKTEINSTVQETLEREPNNFWYFNNGITVLCDSIKKKPLNGNSHDFGVFECKNASIVNGAQTVGSIAEAHLKYPTSIKDVIVMVRFISLESCPEGFSTRVTRATNTQNRVESRDFISLDPEQERLQTELRLDGIEYHYKSGNTFSDPSNGFDVSEAVVALACYYADLSYSVLAKDKVSRLWEDVSKPPYKSLFNSSLSSIKLWNIVQIHRLIDIQLKESKVIDKLIPVHGNRFIERQIFRFLSSDPKEIDKSNYDISGISNLISELTRKITILVKQAIDENYPNSYPANLFRNREKCQNIENWLNNHY